MSGIIKENVIIQGAIRTLYDAMREKEYGEKFAWDELRQMTGVIDLPLDRLYYVCNKVCLLLMEHDQKYLETINSYGKRIILPSEHGIVANKKVKRSVRIYRKAGAVLTSTNMGELTDDQKKQIVYDANKYSTLEMFAREMLNKKQLGKSEEEDGSKASLFLDAIKLFTKQ